VLVLTWFTTDPGIRLVTLTDATTGTLVGSPAPVAAGDLATGGWVPSPRHAVGTLGPVLARTTPTTDPSPEGAATGLVSLPYGWRTTEVTDSAVYGTAPTSGVTPTRLLVTPAGQRAGLGSGSVPLGVVAGRAVVGSTVGADTTLYGLPVATAAPTPTPSASVPAPPPLPSAAPTPAKAPAQTP